MQANESLRSPSDVFNTRARRPGRTSPNYHETSLRT